MPSIDALEIYSIEDFQKGVESGIFNDKEGRAYLIIKGTIYYVYTVHIDRYIVSTNGTIISFGALIKSHGINNIQIGYERRNLSSARACKQNKVNYQTKKNVTFLNLGAIYV